MTPELTHFLAESLHPWLNEETGWEAAMRTYHHQAHDRSEKQYRRTSTVAA